MSLSNTHAWLFTNIPAHIKKTWATATIDTKTGQKAEKSNKHHEQSIIQSVELTVKYNEDLLTNETTFDLKSDLQNDHIDAWREAQNDWIVLDRAIKEAILTFVQRSADRMKEKPQSTFEGLVKVTTEDLTNYKSPSVSSGQEATLYERAALKPMNPRRAPTVMTLHDDDRTIVPHDSISTVSKDDIAAYIRAQLTGSKSRHRRRT